VCGRTSGEGRREGGRERASRRKGEERAGEGASGHVTARVEDSGFRAWGCWLRVEGLASRSRGPQGVTLAG